MSAPNAYRLTVMAAPMAIWALHFVVVYSLTGLACGRGWYRSIVGGQPIATWVLIAVTLLAWAVLAWLGWSAWRSRKQADTGSPASPRRRFVARMTLALAWLAILAVAFTALPVLMLPPCEG